MAPKKKKTDEITITVRPTDKDPDVIADLTDKLFRACVLLVAVMVDGSYDDDVELPGDLEAWYRAQVDKRAKLKSEIRLRALQKLTAEERDALEV